MRLKSLGKKVDNHLIDAFGVLINPKLLSVSFMSPYALTLVLSRTSLIGNADGMECAR